MRKAAWIAVLMMINAVLDFFSLASLLPLVFVIVKPDGLLITRLNYVLPPGFQQSGAPGSVVVLASVVLTMIIVKNLASYWIFKVRAEYAFELTNGLSALALKKYLTMQYQGFIEGNSTKALNSIINYPLAFANHIILALATIITELVVSILIITAVLLYNPGVLFVSVIVILPVFILYYLTKSRINKIGLQLKEVYPQMLKDAMESIEGYSEIKISGTAGYFLDRFQKTSKKVTDVFVQDQLSQSSTIRLTEILLAFVICFLAIFTVNTQPDFRQSLLMLSVFAAANLRLIPSLNKIVNALQQIKIHEHIVYEFESLIKNQEAGNSPPTNAVFSFSDRIILENLTFSYSKKEILSSISLTIRKGEKVAFTGHSGEGKTTLLLIILRLLKETKGSFLVDGRQIENNDAWRKIIAYIPQTPYLLNASIVENVAFGTSVAAIDRKRVLDILESLNLGSTIVSLPDSIDTVVGERGIKLSGGQRQRLAIARALYANADILLLDEITNQLHKEGELEIMKILGALSKQGKTIIMVAHQLPSKVFFDIIYRLRAGVLKPELQQDPSSIS